jgi:hypothetical protein
MPDSPVQRSFAIAGAKESIRQLYTYLGMPADRVERAVERTQWPAPAPKPRPGRPRKSPQPAAASHK